MCGKVKFTKVEAVGILNLIKSGRRKKYRKETRYYHCPECNHWHLTSIEKYETAKEVKLIEPERWERLLGS